MADTQSSEILFLKSRERRTCSHHAKCLVNIYTLIAVPAIVRFPSGTLTCDQTMQGGDGRARIGSRVIRPRCEGNARIEETGAAFPVFRNLLLRCRVRHRFRATFSRQPRQVRKEATVTGSFVCSGAPVPGFLFCHVPFRYD